MFVVHRYPGLCNDMIRKVGVRRLRPERQAEGRHAPVHPSVRLRPVGAVHRAPLCIADLVFGRPVGHGMSCRVTFLEVFGLDMAGMEETEMRRVDIAFEAL